MLDRLMPAAAPERLIADRGAHRTQADQSIQHRMLAHLQADGAGSGARVAAALGLILPPRWARRRIQRQRR